MLAEMTHTDCFHKRSAISDDSSNHARLTDN